MIKYKRYERYKDSGVEWLGELPEHWEIGRLKNSIKSCRNGIWGDEPQGDNNDVACIRVVDFNRTNMEIEVNNLTIRNVPASKQKMYLLKRGDLLIEKSGGGEKQPVGFVTIFNHDIPAVYANFIARMELEEEKVYSGFYKYVHSAMYSVRLNVRSIKQTTGIQNLDTNYYFEESVIYPPLNEQKIIANFLDQKIAEIDDLIADKEKLIELLQEKRQAIITEAVTKGLNPNVRMKDSGIEWIGEIPEHWEVKRIKYLTIVNPNKSEVRHLPSEQEVTFIPMEKIIATGKVDYSLTNTIENLVNGYTYFRDGDIIMAKVTPCFENGNIAIVEGLLNGIGFGTTELHVLRCNNKCFNKFLFYYLQSDVFKSKGVSEMYGVAGLKRIPTDFILNYKLGIPDYLEQEQIANYLDEKTSQIDELISNIQLQIQKLKEYRQSLISETVTGKIDVRDYYVNN